MNILSKGILGLARSFPIQEAMERFITWSKEINPLKTERKACLWTGRKCDSIWFHRFYEIRDKLAWQERTLAKTKIESADIR